MKYIESDTTSMLDYLILNNLFGDPFNLDNIEDAEFEVLNSTIHQNTPNNEIVRHTTA